MMKISKIIPRYDWILVEQDETSKETESGIMTPSNVEEEQKAIGTVINIGDEIKDIKIGDRVIFPVFAGEKLDIKDDKNYRFLKDDDVIALIKE